MHAEADIVRLAFQDRLTRLDNRLQFQTRLNKWLQESAANGHSGARLLIDLDHFRSINDARTFEVGDQVLCAISERLRQLPVEATLERIGGDEIAFALGSSTRDSSANQA